MTHVEKVLLLKESISYLYEKEGRSKKYISDVLKVDRKILSDSINKWGMVKADEAHLAPSKQKFLNSKRKQILDGLQSGLNISDISDGIGIDRTSLVRTYIHSDKELFHEYNEYWKRRKAASSDTTREFVKKSRYQYNMYPIDDEIWKPILGYEGYEVSNMGRVRKYTKSYKKYHLVKPSKNIQSGYWYVSLFGTNDRKNLSLSRVVAHAFVDGFDCTHNNTVDHIDGNKDNNASSNLQWVSQKENNERSYKNGKKGHAGFTKNPRFNHILLDNKYEFKTIAALGKFLGVSETQASRYISNEAKSNHTFTFVR